MLEGKTFKWSSFIIEMSHVNIFSSRFFRQFITFFCTYEMALGLYRFISAIARTLTAAITLGTFTLLVILVLGGFVVAKSKPYMNFILNVLNDIFPYFLSVIDPSNIISISVIYDAR